MNEASLKSKQQVVDKIKSTTNILITVSKDPTVDELSAALGLTALLDKLDKHATAIFSGVMPPAINFLNPDAVFEDNANSLRDFIIALDKDKADHLRYKLDGDVVKIFITPYRTSINSDDLDFSQGDYNVELVLALGVANQEHLDEALVANGQIMDDATIVTFSAGSNSSQLGSLDWRDESASCLCEMVTSLAASLKTNKALLDKQIATALLTGIVSATDRFSNSSTSSQVMNISAELMAAGADQQLIAAKLQESHAIQSVPADTSKIATTDQPQEPSEVRDDGSLVISHDVTPVKQQQPSPIEEKAPSPVIEKSTLPPVSPTEVPANEANEQIINESKEETPAEEPELGGTLNATADQAAEDARRELEDEKNKTILSHSYIAGSDQGGAINGNVNGADSMESTFAEGGAFNGNMPSSTLPPTMATPSITLPMPPPVPDFSTLPQDGEVTNPPIPQTPVINMPPNANPSVSTLPPEPVGQQSPLIGPATTSGIPKAPPVPNLPNDVPAEPSVSTLPPEPATVSNDPGQFRIPGQK